MAELFATGRIALLLLLFMLAEFAVLAGIRGRYRIGLPLGPLASNLAAGAALLLALRAALVAAGWQSICVWLLAALIAHGVDLKMRWQAR